MGNGELYSSSHKRKCRGKKNEYLLYRGESIFWTLAGQNDVVFSVCCLWELPSGRFNNLGHRVETSPDVSVNAPIKSFGLTESGIRWNLIILIPKCKRFQRCLLSQSLRVFSYKRMIQRTPNFNKTIYICRCKIYLIHLINHSSSSSGCTIMIIRVFNNEKSCR